MIGREKSRHCQTCLKLCSLLNGESRIELRNLQILKKMLEKSSQFFSSGQPCEPKNLDVALKITGVEEKLEPRDSILKPRCSKRSRIESRGSRNKAFSNMQKLERVSKKRFISRRKNNTVLRTPKVQTFRVDRYRMKTFDHTIAD